MTRNRFPFIRYRSKPPLRANLSQVSNLRRDLVFFCAFNEEGLSQPKERASNSYVSAISNINTTYTQFGPAALFSKSSSYLQFGNPPSFGTPLSILCAVSANSYTTNNALVCRDPVNTVWLFFLEGGLLKWRGGSNGVLASVSVANLVNKNVYIFGVSDTGILNDSKLYINGVQGQTNNNVVPAGTSSNSISVGGFGGATSSYGFDGYILYVAIWNRVLSPNEFAAIGSSPDGIWQIFEPQMHIYPTNSQIITPSNNINRISLGGFNYFNLPLIGTFNPLMRH